MKTTENYLKKIIRRSLLKEADPSLFRTSGGMPVSVDKKRKFEKREEEKYKKYFESFAKNYLERLNHLSGLSEAINNSKIDLKNAKVVNNSNSITISFKTKMFSDVHLTISKEAIDETISLHEKENSSNRKIHKYFTKNKERLAIYSFLMFFNKLCFEFNRLWHYLNSDLLNSTIKKAKQKADAKPIIRLSGSTAEHAIDGAEIDKIFQQSFEDLRSSKLDINIGDSNIKKVMNKFSSDKNRMNAFYHPMLNKLVLGKEDFIKPAKRNTMRHELNHKFRSHFGKLNALLDELTETHVDAVYGSVKSLIKFLSNFILSGSGKNKPEIFIRQWANIAKKYNLEYGGRPMQMKKITLPNIDYRNFKEYVIASDDKNSIMSYHSKDSIMQPLDREVAISFYDKTLNNLQDENFADNILEEIRENDIDMYIGDYIRKFYCLQADHILEVGTTLSRVMLAYHEKKVAKLQRKVSVNSDYKDDLKKKQNLFINGSNADRKKYAKNFMKGILKGRFDVEGGIFIDIELDDYSFFYDDGVGHNHDLKWIYVVKDTPKTLDYFVNLILNYV